MGTQVMVVTSSLHKYIAVVFAGTDDLRTVSSDLNIVTAPFHGPLLSLNGTTQKEDDKRREKLQVHAGFDHAVFNNGLFDDISSILALLKNNTYNGTNQTMLQDYSNYQIIATGHSLGGANAILASAALSALYPAEHIMAITFGCPQTGLTEWSLYYNSLITNYTTTTASSQNTQLSSYQFVLGKDAIPRLPSIPFYRHVGHTIQMNVTGNMKAYYLHYGDDELGYAGVPAGWNVESMVHFIDSFRKHSIRKYVEYIEERNDGTSVDDFYVSDFERVEIKRESEMVTKLS
mmetsp:Transcript_42574/g.64108  ORF Transcript_42574/g.64108 Transcript_42574/m.64108 type:complete len:290 (+) Transcript_42574:519-1388(+)